MSSIDLLPGRPSLRASRTRQFTFNVIVTGICNAHCAYCHYYARRDRKEVARHLPKEVFEVYMHFIRHWTAVFDGETRYRFSGGDPMTMKDRLFEYADLAHGIVGRRPFLMTAGKALSSEWLDKAKRSSLSHACISVENPWAPDPGAPDPRKVIDFIRQHNSADFPLMAGVCVVSPSQYSRLPEIIDWFYEHLGHIPVIHEVNYDAYISPDEQEWKDLKEVLPEILKKYAGKTPLILFPSVAPELAFGGDDAYVFDLDLSNVHSLTMSNYRERVEALASRLRRDYPPLVCGRTACSWWEYCDNVKWFWVGDRSHSRQEKLSDYCRFKRILSDAYYRYLVDENHTDTFYKILDVQPVE